MPICGLKMFVLIKVTDDLMVILHNMTAESMELSVTCEMLGPMHGCGKICH